MRLPCQSRQYGSLLHADMALDRAAHVLEHAAASNNPMLLKELSLVHMKLFLADMFNDATYQRSIAWLQRAVDANPGDRDCLINLGNMHIGCVCDGRA